MKTRYILLLSLCGLVLGLMRVFFLPAKFDALVSLPMFFWWAWVFARNMPSRFFIHGLLTSILASLWSFSVQMLLADYLMRYNTADAAQYRKIVARLGGSVHEAIGAFAIINMVFSMLVAGGLAHAVGRIVRRLGGER